ncbi:MAG: hypothetical protein C5B59_01770 [Bacteroidetes bacterium]|nr:MAG: hypothetical protein C5B59_01770 [Bacteroidota bacterium]
MKKNIPIYFLIILTGCYSSAPITYKAEKTKGVDYKKYKTYAFLATNDTAYTNILDKKKVEAALASNVKNELDKRGFKLDTLNPDCLFTYTLVMNKTYQIGEQPPEIYNVHTYAPTVPGANPIYYYRTDYGIPAYKGGMMVTTFRDGTLLIDMIDRESKEIIWRTSAEGKRNENEAQGARATINEIVPKMFKKFPVKGS